MVNSQASGLIPLERFSVEKFLRYFASGAFILVIAVASYPQLHGTIETKIGAASYFALAPITGMCVYSIYHLVLKWLVFDRIAYVLALSYPGKYRFGKPRCRQVPRKLHCCKCIRRLCVRYSKAYSEHLKERYRSDTGFDSLSGYLYFRWALAHLATMIAISLVVFSLFNARKSFTDEHEIWIGTVGVFLFLICFWHQMFLYRVESLLLSGSSSSPTGASKQVQGRVNCPGSKSDP